MSLLSIEKISKKVKNQKILNNFTLSVEPGDSIGVKLTHDRSNLLASLLKQEVKPSTGQINVNTDKMLFDLVTDGLYQKMSVGEYLRFFAKLAAFKDQLEPLNEYFSLNDVWDTPIKNISLDQQQRLKLFRMYLYTPELVVIQEPLSDLSDEGIELYLKAVQLFKNQHIALLYLTNYVENLFLLTEEVYRYNDKTGLEKIETENDGDLNNQLDEQFKNRVFKVASKFEDKTVFFSPNEIDFIESIDGVSNLNIDGESFPTELTMNELEKRLSSFGFFRCHRSYIVNLQRIAELISFSKNSYTLTLKTVGRDKLPLSRSKLSEMKQLLGVF